MKLKSLCFGLLFLLGLAFPSYSQNTSAANEIHLSLNGINDIAINYDDEEITVFTSDSNELLVKEYMSTNKKSFYANVKVSGSSIHISEGLKPLSKKSFIRRVEVYIPSSYSHSLSLSTTNGDINMGENSLKLAKLHVNSTSGSVNINNADAKKIILTTTSGTITCNELVGNIDFKGTHGSIYVKSAKGSGTYKVENSGKIDVNYSEVNGDLYFYNKNNDINIILPENLAFQFEAKTKNGSISTPFQDGLTFKEKTATVNIGKNPSVNIRAESNNGNIFVSM